MADLLRECSLSAPRSPPIWGKTTVLRTSTIYSLARGRGLGHPCASAPVELPLPAQAYSDAKNATAQGQQGCRLRRRSPRHEVLRLSVCPSLRLAQVRLPDGHVGELVRCESQARHRIEKALRSRRQRFAAIGQPPDGSLIIGVAAVASVLEQPSLHLSDCRAKSDFVMLSRGDCSLSMKAAFLGIR